MLNLVKSWLLTKSIFMSFTVKCSCNIFDVVLRNMGLYVCLFWGHLRCLMQHMTCWWQFSVILAQMSGVFHLGTGYICCLALHFYIHITGYTIIWSFSSCFLEICWIVLAYVDLFWCLAYEVMMKMMMKCEVMSDFWGWYMEKRELYIA